MISITDFTTISIINLPKRTDRLREISDQLNKIGLTFESPNVNLFSAIRPANRGGFDSIGAHGCFLSHLQVLRNAQKSDNLMILEDDLDFVPGIDELLKSALKNLPKDWGIFYGGCAVDLPLTLNPIQRVSCSDDVRCSYFVAFNGPVIPVLIDYLSAILQRPPGHQDGGPMHVDGAYACFRIDNPNIFVYAARPELGVQRPSRTDIHLLKWFDRIPFVRDFVQLVRRHRAAK